jgi:hypothetical protein
MKTDKLDTDNKLTAFETTFLFIVIWILVNIFVTCGIGEMLGGFHSGYVYMSYITAEMEFMLAYVLFFLPTGFILLVLCGIGKLALWLHKRKSKT